MRKQERPESRKPGLVDALGALAVLVAMVAVVTGLFNLVVGRWAPSVSRPPAAGTMIAVVHWTFAITAWATVGICVVTAIAAVRQSLRNR
jgi:hypothetical protein